MKVSIGIPCFNQQDHLNGLLKSLEGSDVDEILVVDDGSTDRIGTIPNFLPVRVLRHEDNLGLASARNTIVRETNGDVVFFLDCDVRMRSYSKEVLEAAFASESVVAVTGRAIEDGSRGAADLWRSRFWVQDHGTDPGEVDFAYGLCCAWRRDTVVALGGFSESLLSHGEDVDLSIRAITAGFNIVHLPEIRVEHRRQDSLGSLLRMVWLHSFFFSKVCLCHRHPAYRRALLNSLKWCAIAPVSSISRHRDMASAMISVPCCAVSVVARLAAGVLSGMTNRPENPVFQR